MKALILSGIAADFQDLSTLLSTALVNSSKIHEMKEGCR
jgi:hypothetical protein